MMNRFSRFLNQPNVLFFLGCVLFFIMAALGWEKLHHGLSMLDEGWHHVESWRLTQGDHVFKSDLFSGPALYTLFNAAIYHFFPDATLLDFRKLQYGLTLYAVILLGLAYYSVHAKYWFLPWVMSLFAFTGLEPMGLFSNLNYYSYSSLFITLHLASFMAAAHARNPAARLVLFLVSGLMLWAITVNLLFFCLLGFWPLILYWVMKKRSFDTYRFSRGELKLVLAPSVILWVALILVYNKHYVWSLLWFLDYAGVLKDAHQTRFFITLTYLALGFVYALACFLLIRVKGRRLALLGLALVGAGMFRVIQTSLWGELYTYKSMWLIWSIWPSVVLIGCFSIMGAQAGIKFLRSQPFSREQETVVLLLIPCVLFTVIKANFSGMGVITTLLCAMPALLAVTLFFFGQLRFGGRAFKLLALVLFLFPLYFWTAYSDWRLVSYDLSPKGLTRVMDRGFVRAIKTNPDYYRLYNWIMDTSEKYSAPDDYILAYQFCPMVYMVAGRRPATQDTWVNLQHDAFLKRHADNVEKMKTRGRYPKLAYIFTGVAVLEVPDLRKPGHVWPEGSISFPEDPLSAYVARNMVLRDEFRINGEVFLRLYEDPLISPDRPGDINNQGLRYMKQGRIPAAREFFEKALAKDPSNIPAHYNLACLEALGNRPEKAMEQLSLALDLGFADAGLLLKDPDLERVRRLPGFEDLVKKAGGRVSVKGRKR